jgi:hypothetical protein
VEAGTRSRCLCASHGSTFPWSAHWGEPRIDHALTHTIAAGTTGTFASFRDIKLGNDGRVTFIGTLTPGVGGVDLTNNVGIWIGSSASDLQLVARTGQLVDGQVLVALPTAFGQFDMNDEGVVWIGTFPSRATAVVFSRVRGERDGQAGS